MQELVMSPESKQKFYFDYFARWDNLGLLGFHRIFIGVELCKNW